MAARGKGQEDGASIVLHNFPRGWFYEGKAQIIASLEAQLEVFGPLKSPPLVSPKLDEAEVTFEHAKSAQEAVEVLNGADIRVPEELETDSRYYAGLSVALKPRGHKRTWEEPNDVNTGFSYSPAAHFVAPFVGTWSIGYEGSRDDMVYTIERNGQVRVGKKRVLQVVLAGSSEDTRQDANYIGTLLLNNAHREGTWEYLWIEADHSLGIHHFSDGDTKISPFGSKHYWGSGVGKFVEEVKADPEPSEVQAKRQKTWDGQQSKGQQSWGSWGRQPWGRQSSWGKRDSSTPASPSLAAFEGMWTIVYENDPDTGNHMVYTFAANGDVTVGKKRHTKLVPAGSKQDSKCDPNYSFEGVFFLDQCHREDTWEYLWMDSSGGMQVHHFTSFDTGTSPFGSPHFWGQGVGVPAHETRSPAEVQPQLHPLHPAMRQQSQPGGPHIGPWQTSPGIPSSPSVPSGGSSYWRLVGARKATAPPGYPAAPNAWGAADQSAGGWGRPETSGAFSQAVAYVEGQWTIEYDPGAGGWSMTYIIYDTGEVRIGKKRRGQLELVGSGSAGRRQNDPNYEGVFLLNNAQGEDTWEYIWVEDDRLQIHHFTGDATGVSPLGSSNYFGSAVGTRKVV